jgi:ABC-type transporter Mla subunit MlaD
LRETSALVGQLDDKGASLSEATQASAAALHAVATRLEQVEARVGKALAERKNTLDELHGLISHRTNDVESVTRSFAALIDDSLSAAEARARQIGGVLSESAEASTHAIEQQFEVIRAATGKERERTANALRAAYEQVTNEVGNELAKVTERFQSAAKDMRSVTADIQRELEATRAELKRGVLELPRETQESTSAMRRVVSEQIKALNELTEIVTKSGRRNDVSRPATAGRVARRAAPAASRCRPIRP